MKSRMSRTARRLRALTMAGAIGLLLPAPAVLAQANPPGQGGQGGQAEKSPDEAAAAKPGSVGGVVVQAPRPPSKLEGIPPEKAAGFDEEAAKNEAWKKYRKSTPPVDAGTLGQAKDYPGLQSLLPPP